MSRTLLNGGDAKYRASDEWTDYKRNLVSLADRHDVYIASDVDNSGLFDGDSEPSGRYVVEADNPAKIEAWAEAVRVKHGQYGVMVSYPDPNGRSSSYSIRCDDLDVDLATEGLKRAGIRAAAVSPGHIDIIQMNGSLSPQQVQTLEAFFGSKADVQRVKVRRMTRDGIVDA